MYITDQIYSKKRIVEKKAERMAEYGDFEKSIYEIIHNKPCTSIATKPPWAQRELFVEKTEQIGLEMNVSYIKDGEYGGLSKTHGEIKYL